MGNGIQMRILVTEVLPSGGPGGKEGLRRRTVTNLTVNATSQIFTTGAFCIVQEAIDANFYY